VYVRTRQLHTTFLDLVALLAVLALLAVVAPLGAVALVGVVALAVLCCAFAPLRGTDEAFLK
jgi:hypothetical protein